MTNYREILRLKSLGISERDIARSLGVSHNTISRVLKRALELQIQWPLDASATNGFPQKELFPPKEESLLALTPYFF